MHVKWRPMIRSAEALRRRKLNAIGTVIYTNYGEQTGQLVTVKWPGGKQESVSVRDLQPV